MFAELGLGDVIDQATHHNPEMRDLTVGEAVKAMVLNLLGQIPRSLLRLLQWCYGRWYERLSA